MPYLYLKVNYDTLHIIQNWYLYSVGGYLSLHIAGVAWGHEIFSRPKTYIKHYQQEAVVLMQWVFLMWSSLYSSIHLQVFLPPSRRMANWTYFNWMIAYNLSLILLFLLCYIFLSYCQYLKRSRTSLQTISEDTQTKTNRKSISSDTSSKRRRHRNTRTSQSEESDSTQPETTSDFPCNDSNASSGVVFNVQVPILFSAISSNGLIYFLLANLFTGLINLTLPTIHIDGCPAVLIICGYMAALNAIIVLMYRMKFKLI